MQAIFQHSTANTDLYPSGVHYHPTMPPPFSSALIGTAITTLSATQWDSLPNQLHEDHFSTT